MSSEKQEKSEPTIDLNQYVSKETYERELKSKEEDLARTKAEQEKLKVQLLDPAYLEWLNAKKNPIPAQKEPSLALFDDLKPEDIDRLPNSKVLALAEKTLGPKFMNAVRAEVGKDIGVLKQTLQDVIYHIELRDVIDSNDDWEEHKADVQRILETASNDLTIAQALELARSRKVKEEPKEPTKPVKGSEKPGSPPQPAVERKFKNEDEAKKAAWDTVREKYGITSDTI